MSWAEKDPSDPERAARETAAVRSKKAKRMLVVGFIVAGWDVMRRDGIASVEQYISGVVGVKKSIYVEGFGQLRGPH